MKTKSFTLAVALVIGATALFATPAEAGKRKKHHHHNDNSYYQRNNCDRGYYQPVQYYRPVRYVPAQPYYQRPAFQIGFSFGGNRNNGGYCGR